MSAPTIAGYSLKEAQSDGTFGTVYRAQWGRNVPCAVKVLRLKTIQPAYVSWCLENLIRAGQEHPHIVSIHGFDLTHEPAYVATDWIEPPSGGIKTLEDAVGKWSVPQILRALSALCRVLKWLHERSLIHTGITTSNVLLRTDEPESVCLTDLGQGLVDATQQAQWQRHAPYLSPERCRLLTPHGDTSGETWDIYAFGVIAYRLLTGRFPRGEKYLEQQNGPFKLDAWARQLDGEPAITWDNGSPSEAEVSLRKIVERCLSLSEATRFQHFSELAASLGNFDQSHQPESSPMETAIPAAPLTSSTQDDASSPPITVSSPASSSLQTAAPTTPTTPSEFLRSPAASTRPWALAACVAVAAAVFAAASAGHFYQQRNKLSQRLEDSEGIVNEARKQSAQHNELVDKQNAAARAATAEQQRLRLNISHEQQTSDHLLATLLDQQPREDHLLQLWRHGLEDYSAQAHQRLKLLDSDPQAKEATARTRWHLAQIALVQGDTKAASTLLDEALRDVETAANAAPSKLAHAELGLLGGKIQVRRGAASLASNRHAEAIQELERACSSLEHYLELKPEDSTASRELSRATCLKGKALLAKPDPVAAMEPLIKATQTAQQLILSPAQREEDIFLLVDSYHELAQAHTLLEKMPEALKCYFEPLEFLRKYERDNKQSTGASRRLAASYIGIGRTLHQLGNLTESSQALNQGIHVLLDLVKDHPEEEIFAFQLGTAYGEVARLVNSAKSAGDAHGYAQSAVDFLRIVTEKNPVDPRYRLHYAMELTSLAEIQEGLSKYAEAIKSGGLAQPILEALMEDNSLPNRERNLAQERLARLFSSLGRAHAQLKSKENAIQAYTQATTTWTKVLNLDPKNTTAQTCLKRAEEELARLKP